MSNPFVLEKKEYKRDLNILKAYLEDSALYLAKMSGKPLEVCRQFVSKSVKPGGQFEFKDPRVSYLERKDNGDRVKLEGTMTQYLGDSIRSGDLIAPTFTTYLPPSVKQSILVNYIDANITGRNIAKDEQFAAMVAGDKRLESIKEIEQKGKKLDNNAISGGHVSPSTILHNRTSHSTLTSNCRCTAGYGNSNNEKFLAGNRHYWSPDIVRQNIISIINHSDYVAIEKAMTQYGIRHPSAEETMQCIKRGVELYWCGPFDMERIRLLVNTLTDIERSAFVYTGDFYHLRQFNPELVRQMVGKLASMPKVAHPDPIGILGGELINPDGSVKKVKAAAPEADRHLAAQICSEYTAGTKVAKMVGTDGHAFVASTAMNISETLDEYALLIKAFWVTTNVPSSMAYFPESMRHVVITGDTDSTIFSVQEWVQWFRGKVVFDPQSTALSATMIYLAQQTISHLLARMSANFGIEEKRIHQIAMKNEYAFDVFVPTQVAKHYYAIMSAQEGNVFLRSKFKRETKGVHLKNSNAPKAVMKMAQAMMDDITDSVYDGKSLSLSKYLRQVAATEIEVLNSVRRGEFSYFRRAQIKTPNSYVQVEAAPNYQQFIMWSEVFSPSYGAIPPPPYTALKVSVALDTPMKTKKWLEGMKDQALADRMRNYLARSNRRHVGSSMLIPEQALMSTGIPQEIKDVIDYRKMAFATSKVFYMVLETLGQYFVTSKLRVLAMDYYAPTEEELKAAVIENVPMEPDDIEFEEEEELEPA